MKIQRNKTFNIKMMFTNNKLNCKKHENILNKFLHETASEQACNRATQLLPICRRWLMLSVWKQLESKLGFLLATFHFPIWVFVIAGNDIHTINGNSTKEMYILFPSNSSQYKRLKFQWVRECSHYYQFLLSISWNKIKFKNIHCHNMCLKDTHFIL